MKKKIFSVLLCTTMLMCSAVGCESDKSNRNSTQSINSSNINLNDIESMEISRNSGYLSYTYTYEFNFDNNFVICEKEADNWEEETKTYCIDFTDKDAEYFVKKANLYGFFSWEESYMRNNVNRKYGGFTLLCNALGHSRALLLLARGLSISLQ